jgi:hypothetical protein
MLRTLLTASLLMVSFAFAEGGSQRIVFEASGTEHTWPVEEINSQLPSDWSGYQYLVFELRASTPQRFEVRLHTSSGVRGLWMHPFAGAWIRTALPLAFLAQPEQSAVDLAAMSNKPRPLSFFSGAHGQGPLNQVQRIGVRMPSPVGAAALELRTVRLAKDDPGDELLESRALVDRFGQWIPAEWPGKARDVTQLRGDWTAESKALRGGSFAWGKYGGYAATKARATGFFRVEKIDNRWWFVDPDGHLFLSTGADATRSVMETTTFSRGGIFEAMPPAELNRLSSRGEDRQMVSFYTWNLLRRFGSNWQEQWVDHTLKRMATWGLNTVANWSDPALWAARRAPYVIPLEGWGMESGWFGMPDVYSPEWPKQVDEAARRQCAPRRSDPWLLGYFVANEPSWPGREALAAEQILQRRNTATKRELLAFLAQGDTPERRKAFLIRCFERELEVINAAIRKYDSNHLNLGIRFGGHPDEEVVGVARVFDVFSLNIYSEVPDRARLDRIYALTKRPILIGEFHMGTPGRGMSAGLVTVRDQGQRGVAYRYYVENAFAMPALIGAHWFQWADEANTGRSDGENYNIGFIDVTDRPYRELVDAAKQTHQRMFSVHSGSEHPIEQRAVSR